MYMKYNLGLCSISFRKNSACEVLQAMKACGLSFVEWGSDVHCPPEKAEQIATLQREFNITCSSYGTYFKIGVTPIDEIFAYIDAAKILGTDILRLWCGNKNSEEYLPKEKQSLFDECKKLAKIAKENGVTFCMECHGGTYTNCKESARELMVSVNSSHFKLYWQPNQYRSEAENMAYAKLLSPYTEHIHVFNWTEKERFPLGDAVSLWKEYLSYFSDNTLLLEFMPDDSIASLKTEAEALRRLIK